MSTDRALGETSSGREIDGRRSREIRIDLARLALAGFVSPDAPRTQSADEFRVIKRPLLTQAFDTSDTAAGNRNLIMVTSALPGEGKTFTSINLALSIAMELDHTVLLVDADVARPAVLERLGIERAPGLLDILSDDRLDLSEVLLRTNVDRLTILPAGSPHDRTTELLASDAMNRLLGELATRYPDRILIFDAPPLLPSTESRVLATHMSQVILVVEAERTPQAVVKQALATIEDCPLVMTLLNKVAHSDVGSYYGYYGNPPT
jgi:receptor protein-tyrosine kinase